jgi:glycine betaine/proline transport system substrate-binding protein
MKQLLATTLIVSAFCATPAFAQDGQCGRVTIANMNWQSAELIAWIDRIILREGYGCEVEMVPGDTQPTLTSMAEKGEPDIAPEAWINSMRETLDKAVADKRLVYAVEELGEGGVEGWWIPDYVAAAHPDIKTIDDALAHPELFPAPEDPSKGAVYNCPSGWNCQITTGNLFKAYGAEEKGFQLIDTGSAAGLDGSIAKAFERKQAWLGYYWAPTSILGKYKMVRLGHGVPYDADEWNKCASIPDCAVPKKNAWAKSEVFTVVTRRFADEAGPAYTYVKTRSFPTNAPVNEMLSWMTDNQATGEEGARHFLAEQSDIWTKWVPDDVAAKVKAAL